MLILYDSADGDLTDVQGVLILSRPSGIILRSSGGLFALQTSAKAASPAPTSQGSEEELAGSNEVSVAPTVSELALKYSRLATRLVESVGEEVRAVVDNVSLRMTFVKLIFDRASACRTICAFCGYERRSTS